MAQRDPYSVLGVDRKASAGRDQEGLPQARAPVPPGPQPGRPQGRGALQGDPVGVRHRRRPGQAQAVRPRRDLLRLRRPAGAGGGAGGQGGFGGFEAGGFGDILSNLFGGGEGRRRRHGRRAADARRARRRPRGRGHDHVRAGDRGHPGAAERRGRPRRARPAAGPARSPAPRRRSARAVRAAASSRRARGCSRSPSRAPAATAPAP